MLTKTSSFVTLLDLHQDVLHEIFRYLDRNHLCFSVRHVCKAMKIHVESFMPAIEKFMLVDQSGSNRLFMTILVIYMFKRRYYPPLLYMKVKSVFPLPKPVNNSKESITCVELIGNFGGLINERLIAGYFCVEKVAKPKSLHSLWERLGQKRSPFRRFCRLIPYLYEYEESTKAWKSVPPHKKGKIGYMIYDHRVKGELSFSRVGNAIIVGLRMKANCQLNEVGDPVYAWMESHIAKFHFYATKDSYKNIKDNRSMIEYSVSYFGIPSQIKGDNFYCTVSSKNSKQEVPGHDNDNIYLHGFNIINGDHNFFICQLQSRLFKLNALNDEVRYHKLPLREGGKYYFCSTLKKSITFKLKSNIYTIGLFEDIRRKILPIRLQTSSKLSVDYFKTLECDRYDIERDEYFASENEIPSFINDVYSVETDSNESYALILTNIGLIPFTTKNGFEYGIETEDRWINLESINRIYLQD